VCAVSGIAGPAGGTREKPVGTVYAGFCLRKSGIRKIRRYFFEGDRRTVKRKTAEMMGKDIVNFLKEDDNC
jgi:nicotinamide mononucleotide (NMN) deamidase PncC